MVVFFLLQELEREEGRGEWEGEREKGRAELSAQGWSGLTSGSAGGYVAREACGLDTPARSTGGLSAGGRRTVRRLRGGWVDWVVGDRVAVLTWHWRTVRARGADCPQVTELAP